MLKALGFRSSPSPVNDPASQLKRQLASLSDAIALEKGLRAMDLVMDDRPSEAQALLKDGHSTYDKLARGVIAFIEATLGFEADAIKKAVDSLYEAEQSSQKDRARAQKSGIRTSSKYPPGTEFALTYAESHLLGAIALFLSESMLDSAKALLKLRKAYQVLDEINRSVSTTKEPYLSARASTSSFSVTNSEATKSVSSLSSASVPATGTNTPSSQSSAETKVSDLDAKGLLYEEMRYRRKHRAAGPSDADIQVLKQSALLNGGPMADTFQSVDEFIQSGVDTMFGLLQLIISIIPPAVGKVLSIVGFRGDKETGLQMLWRASEHTNIHGAISLLALLQFYDGPTQFSDIPLPAGSEKDDVQDLNREPQSVAELIKTKQLLEKALIATRQYYPRGALWQLQEGRMVASAGDLRKAVEIMDDDSQGKIEMKQVDGLMLFDKNIILVTLHEFERSGPNFLDLIELNTWSHALYLYMAGASYVEIYRQNRDSDPQAAKAAKAKAKDCIDKISQVSNKKRFMAKTMPFDVFVARKVAQWKAVSEETGLDIIDSIGTSPIFEAIYFWNGYNRMTDALLEASLKLLAYSGSDGPYADNKAPLKEVESEAVTRLMLQSICLRKLGKEKEGVELLDAHVMNKIWTPQPAKGHTKSGLPKVHYNKHHRDPWLGPSAIYERAIFEWKLSGIEMVERVNDYFELAMAWADDYELSTRVTMRIKSAQDRLNLVSRTHSNGA